MQKGEQAMTDFTTPTSELSLQEMLADPIVKVMMARDGVTRQDVEGLIEKVRGGMAGGRMAEHKIRRRFNPAAFEELRRR